MTAGQLLVRQRIIDEARSWKGTPFILEACVKHVGVDCVQLARGIGIGAGVLPETFPTFVPYPGGWLLERTDTRYRDALAEHLVLVWERTSRADIPPAPLPADVL